MGSAVWVGSAFLPSDAYRNWWTEYYDVAELGGTHWMHGTADPGKVFRVPQSHA